MSQSTALDLLTARLWTTHLLAVIANKKHFPGLVDIADVKVMLNLREEAKAILTEIERELS